ncbi:hypothetical protein D3C85_1901360 [compost metagenome]
MLVYDEDTEGSPKFMKQQAVQIAANHAYPIITINAYDLQNIAEDEQGDLAEDLAGDLDYVEGEIGNNSDFEEI